MTEKVKKPSPAQRRVLEHLAAGRPSDWHCRTQSDHGGLSGTVVSLHRNGWMRDAEITDAGRAAIGLEPLAPTAPPLMKGAKGMDTSAFTMERLTLDQFIEACKVQAPSSDLIVFRCPMCKTLQTARDLIAAGAGKTFDEVERYLAFSCVGRFTGAPSPRTNPDGKPCNWTLGGLFTLHQLEIETPDGKKHPRFALAPKEEADAYRATMTAAAAQSAAQGEAHGA